MISEKKISCRFRVEKNLARKYMALHPGEKNSITRGLEEINFLHKPNRQYLSFPPQKSNGWPLSNGTLKQTATQLFS